MRPDVNAREIHNKSSQEPMPPRRRASVSTRAGEHPLEHVRDTAGDPSMVPGSSGGERRGGWQARLRGGRDGKIVDDGMVI